VATGEAFVGLISFALATGLLYARFSRPRTMLVYSENALVAPYRDGSGLMLRVANKRESQMIDVSASMIFSWVETTDESQARRFFNLELEYNRINMLSTSWTIVHPIDGASPLAGKTPEELERAEAEILVLLTGIDEAFEQTVHARSSYRAEEIVWNARFQSMFLPVDAQARVSVDISRVHEIEPA